MSDRVLDKLGQALLVTISTPFKPGATHRLRFDAVFEARLSEAVVLFKYMGEAYERGAQLARGDVDAKGLGLGRLYSRALMDAFNFTGKRPLPGLFYSGIMLSVVAGYSESGGDVVADSNKLVRLVPYGSSVEDAVALIEGLEGVGASDHLLALDRGGVTKSSVRLHALSIGDLAEKLSVTDKGFLYNLKGYNVLREASGVAASSSSIAEAVLRVYHRLGVEAGLFKALPPGESLMKYLMDLDRGEYKGSYANDHMLGAVYFSVGLAHLKKDLPLP